jgi:acarbose 7IV-phosphotransferase
MVDANGAGDSFFAGFLYGWMQEASHGRCMQMGAVCAGLCISSKQLVADVLNPGFLEYEMKRHGY